MVINDSDMHWNIFGVTPDIIEYIDLLLQLVLCCKIYNYFSPER